MGRAGDSQYDDVSVSADPTKLSWLVKDATGTGTATKELLASTLSTLIGGGGGGGGDSLPLLRTLTGTSASATHLGTFTGSTIADNQTIKAALQSLETAVESKADNANTVASLAALAGQIAALQPLDSDLTAIAALTTTSYGRSFLDRADAAAARTLLGLGTLATLSASPPAGSSTQVQYNNAGAFAGSTNLTWDNATGTLASQKFKGGESSARSWELATRDSLTTIPVPYFRATTANTVTSLDIMPNGSASDFFGNGKAWIDVCDTDCATGEPPIKTARVGVTATYAEFGSKNFNGAAAHPVAITVGGGSRLLFGTSGLEIMQTASSKFGWGSADPADSVSAMDLVLFRVGQDHLGQARSANAQQWSLYNALNSTNDYERFTIDWKTTTNTVRLGTQKGSSGTARGLKIITDNTERIDVAAAGAIRFNNAYTFPTTDGTNGQVLTTNGSGVVSWLDAPGGGGSGAAPGSNTQIIFNSAGAYAASSGLTWNGSVIGTSGGLTASGNVTANAVVSTTGYFLGSNNNGYLGLGAVTDVRLRRLEAGTFIIDNGSTGPGVLAIDNVQGANFERLKMEWSGNVARIGTSKGGSGTARDFAIITDNTVRVTFAAAGGQTAADGHDMVFGTSTGTKIGTATGQKIGFWNATPVVQQVLATGAGATVDNVIALLQTLGLCKQS